MNNGELHHCEAWRRRHSHQPGWAEYYLAPIRSFSERKWEQWCDKHTNNPATPSAPTANPHPDHRTAPADKKKHKSQRTKCSKRQHAADESKSWRVSFTFFPRAGSSLCPVFRVSYRLRNFFLCSLQCHLCSKVLCNSQYLSQHIRVVHENIRGKKEIENVLPDVGDDLLCFRTLVLLLRYEVWQQKSSHHSRTVSGAENHLKSISNCIIIVTFASSFTASILESVLTSVTVRKAFETKILLRF